MMLIKEYLTQIFESRNWNFDTYQTILIEYGPVLLLAMTGLIIGKFFFGKIRHQWAKFYDRKGISNRWSRFLSRNNHIRFVESWREYLSDRTQKYYFFVSFLICFMLSITSAKLIAYNSTAPGHLLYDPIMAIFTPRDWSKLIFFLEYFAVIVMIFHVSDRPAYFVKCLWGVATLQVIRSIFVFTIPLAPPTDMVFLVDPFTQFFFGEDVKVTNDLFFSGHVSLLAMFYFIADNKYFKWLLLAITLAVGTLIVWQHVHYSYDVLFAPVAAFVIYKFVIAQSWSDQYLQKYKKSWELKG